MRTENLLLPSSTLHPFCLRQSRSFRRLLFARGFGKLKSLLGHCQMSRLASFSKIVQVLNVFTLEEVFSWRKRKSTIYYLAKFSFYGGWRGGPAVKSTRCSYWGLVWSRHPCGGSEPSETPVAGHPMPSDDLLQRQAGTWYWYTCWQTHTQNKVNKFYNNVLLYKDLIWMRFALNIKFKMFAFIFNTLYTFGSDGQDWFYFIFIF